MTYEIITMPGIDGSEVTSIKRTDEAGNVSFIPADESNSDYQAYLKSLEPETVEEPVVEEPPVEDVPAEDIPVTD